MKQNIISPKDVAPGRITHDEFVCDPDESIEMYLDDMKEDMLLVEYENGWAIAVGWYPSFCKDGSFLIELNKTPDNWRPDLERRCRTVLEAREAVLEMATEVRRQF